MSTDDASHPTPPRGTTYYVVALRSTGPENIVPCVYFDVQWQHVQANDLVTASNSNSIRFVDCGTQLPSRVVDQLKSRWMPLPDTGVALFAAVAKTFTVNTPLENLFRASEDHIGQRYIDIPVERGTARGVVLIFRRPSEGGASRLIATADPEIRNGSG